MSGLAEEELEQSPVRLWAKRGAAALAVVAALAGVVVMVQGLFAGKSGPPRQVAKISIIPDTPPPPPPPKVEKKPEPPKEVKEAKVEQPKEVDTPAPPQNEPLKMEGEAGSGESVFAGGTVKNDYIGQPVGAGGGGTRLQFTSYTNLLQRHLQEQLARDRRVKTRDYRVVVRVWLTRQGGIRRAELAGSTGNLDVDDALREALRGIASLGEAPPENMPQPVKVRITNRGTS